MALLLLLGALLGRYYWSIVADERAGFDTSTRRTVTSLTNPSNPSTTGWVAGLHATPTAAPAPAPPPAPAPAARGIDGGIDGIGGASIGNYAYSNLPAPCLVLLPAPAPTHHHHHHNHGSNRSRPASAHRGFGVGCWMVDSEDWTGLVWGRRSGCGRGVVRYQAPVMGPHTYIYILTTYCTPHRHRSF